MIIVQVRLNWNVLLSPISCVQMINSVASEEEESQGLWICRNIDMTIRAIKVLLFSLFVVFEFYFVWFDFFLVIFLWRAAVTRQSHSPLGLIKSFESWNLTSIRAFLCEMCCSLSESLVWVAGHWFSNRMMTQNKQNTGLFWNALFGFRI